MPGGSKELVVPNDAKKENKSEAPPAPPRVIKRPLVARATVDRRTRVLTYAVKEAKTPISQIARIEELSRHLVTYPQTANVAIKVGRISRLYSGGVWWMGGWSWLYNMSSLCCCDFEYIVGFPCIFWIVLWMTLWHDFDFC